MMRLLIFAAFLTICQAIDPLPLSLAEVLDKYHDVSQYAKEIGIQEFDVKFEHFKKSFHRQYTGHDEIERRKYNFLDTLHYNGQHNDLFGNGQATHEVGLTKFADWSDEEYNAISNSYTPDDVPPVPVAVGDSDYDYSSNPLPNSFDWRDQNKVTSIKDQGSCGACWAFATCAAVESQYAINKNILVSLSEQELIDCTNNTEYGENGCGAGSIGAAMKYVKDSGLTELQDYPYIDVNYYNNPIQEQCYSSEVENSFTISGHGKYRPASDSKIMQLIANNGPVAALICAKGKDFKHYKTHSDRPISSGCKHHDHAITIVGYNQESWIIKNSWGTTWGEKGYGYIARGDDVRGINGDIYLPTL